MEFLCKIKKEREGKIKRIQDGNYHKKEQRMRFKVFFPSDNKT